MYAVVWFQISKNIFGSKLENIFLHSITIFLVINIFYQQITLPIF